MKGLLLSNNEFSVIEKDMKLEDMQEIVGGLIEIPYIMPALHEKGIIFIINEEGKFINDIPLGFLLADKDTNRVIDAIMGNVLFLRESGDKMTDITDEDIEFIKNTFILSDVGGPEIIKAMVTFI